MGFNRKKIELERKTEAEKQARARRALDTQILEDALRLVAAWNERQAGRMPMLFSPTIGAAITARHWYSMGALPRLPDHDGNRLTQYRSSPRRGDYQPHSLAVVPVMPTARAVRRIGATVADQRCRRNARGRYAAGARRISRARDGRRRPIRYSIAAYLAVLDLVEPATNLSAGRPTPLAKEVRKMAYYRIYKLSPDDHIAGPPDEMECASDQEVITHAEQQLNGSAVEVWEGARIVIRLQPQDK
jgi:hypothetical protein